MTNGERGQSSQQSLGSAGIRFFTGLVISLVLAFVVGVKLVNRYVVFEIEEANGQQLMMIRSPIGVFTPYASRRGPSTLWAAIYPGSSWDDKDSFIFYGGPAGAEKKMGQLTVLRFTTTASSQRADEWYRNHLGEAFARTRGWILNISDEHEWIGKVHRYSDPDAVVYRRALQGRVQGVVLYAAANGASITLYDFQQAGGG